MLFRSLNENCQSFVFENIDTLPIPSLLRTAFAKLEVPAAPPLERPIIDQTESLANEDIDRIAQLINAERQKKSFQIGVLMIPTLGSDDSLEEYSLKVARQWGIGDKKKSNGVLLRTIKTTE